MQCLRILEAPPRFGVCLNVHNNINNTSLPCNPNIICNFWSLLFASGQICYFWKPLAPSGRKFWKSGDARCGPDKSWKFFETLSGHKPQNFEISQQGHLYSGVPWPWLLRLAHNKNISSSYLTKILLRDWNFEEDIPWINYTGKQMKLSIAIFVRIWHRRAHHLCAIGPRLARPTAARGLTADDTWTSLVDTGLGSGIGEGRGISNKC